MIFPSLVNATKALRILKSDASFASATMLLPTNCSSKSPGDVCYLVITLKITHFSNHFSNSIICNKFLVGLCNLRRHFKTQHPTYGNLSVQMSIYNAQKKRKYHKQKADKK
jgi:hypothetical protein